MNSTEFDVVVPSYRRPRLLERCLDALAAQTLAPAHVVVVLRIDDVEGLSVARAHPVDALVVTVADPGVIAAMAAGVARTTAPWVAFTDDDAAPRPSWLEGLARLARTTDAGAVGGRDVIPGQETPRRELVGRIDRLGRVVGNHHLGFGVARDVDVLKGVNLAVRADVLALPRPGLLRGRGAEVHFELVTCGWVRRAGLRVTYDPLVEVDHEVGERHDRDARGRRSWWAAFDEAHNFVVASSLFRRRFAVRQLLYTTLVGGSGTPGLARFAVALSARRLPPLWTGTATIAGALTGAARLVMLRGDVVQTARELRNRG